MKRSTKNQTKAKAQHITEKQVTMQYALLLPLLGIIGYIIQSTFIV